LSTLYIRLPCRFIAGDNPDWNHLECPFALLSKGNSIERQGCATLSDLSETLKNSQRVVASLAAPDVTLVRMSIPPLSSSRLKAALPNIVEEKLIEDPVDCVIVPGEISEGLTTIAVANREWLECLAKALISFGGRHLSFVPSQLCLPLQSGKVSAFVIDTGGDSVITIRQSGQEGFGLVIKNVQGNNSAREVMKIVSTLIPDKPAIIYVPESMMESYQTAIADESNESDRVGIATDNWSNWIDAASETTLDMAAGLTLGSSNRVDWRTWRWPLALAATVLIVNIAALNFDWWRMKREAKTLRTTMTQVYKAAYPNETVIIDPIAQIQQKIAISKRNSGQAAQDDFSSMIAYFGEAWSSASGSAGMIASLEYRDHVLQVNMKPNALVQTQQVKSFLESRNMLLETASERSGNTVWKIRSKS